MKDASIVHITAHGHILHADIFLAPGHGATIYISNRRTSVDRWWLTARLVVLSCCHSGRGQISPKASWALQGPRNRSTLGSGHALGDPRWGNDAIYEAVLRQHLRGMLCLSGFAEIDAGIKEELPGCRLGAFSISRGRHQRNLTKTEISTKFADIPYSCMNGKQRCL